jgi:hypothetical protein
MADERDRGRGDEVEQDGLGRDAAHGGGRDATSGGSYGRSTGRSGDDLLETGEGSGGGGDSPDDATDRQRDAGSRRQGLEGKGFDAGGGYGGGGNDSLYSAESGYGGQAGGRESSTRGAYAGDAYGRQGDDASTTGGSERGADLPRGTDEQADDEKGTRRGDQSGSGNGGDSDRDAVDLDVRPDVSRRDPTR